MTICIVGVCDLRDGLPRTAVAIADRMITAGDTEFEQEAFSKIDTLTGNCVAITAGSALAHTDLFNATKAKFIGTPAPPIDQVVTEIKSNFVKYRTARAVERYFKPLGITLAYFLENQRSLDNTLVIRLSRLLEEANLGLRIVVAGVDTMGAHVYCIFDPGTSECFDAIGYCSIGSGQRHADSSLINTSYNIEISVEKALYLMYVAKKKAELAPGVGRVYTDICKVNDEGIHNLTSAEIEEL